MAHNRRGEGSSTRLYVGHLSNTVREADLDDEFRRFGRIRDLEMKRGFAFVEFYDPRDAGDAKSEMDRRVIHGSQLIVQFARTGPRGAGSGRGRESGRFGDEGRDACYDDRNGPGGRSVFEDPNFGVAPRNRSRGLSEDRYGHARGYGERNPGVEFPRGGPPNRVGGRGQGPDVCYNCGREGHIARECREGDWSNRCYTCGQYGHIKRQCNRRRSRSNPYRSRSRSPIRETMIRRRSLSRSRSRSPGYRPRRSRNAPSPDSDILNHSPPDFPRRSRSPISGYRDDRRSPGNDSRHRDSPSPVYRRGRSRSPSVPRRDRRLPEYDSQPNDNSRGNSPSRKSLSQRHENGGASHEHRSSDQRDHDGGARGVPYTTGGDNDQQDGYSEHNLEEEAAADKPTEASHRDDDPVNEDEYMPEFGSSPLNEAADFNISATADSPEEKFQV